MVFAATLALLLHVESSQANFLIATTPSNRERPELVGLIGYFVNTVLLPTQVAPSRTISFGYSLKSARRPLEPWQIRQSPFEQVRESIRASRRGTCLRSKVVLTLQNSPMRFPPIVESYQTLDNRTAKFDLVLNLVEHADHFEGWWEYATELFRCETVRRLADRFAQILEIVLTEPLLRPADLLSRIEAPMRIDPADVAAFQLPERDAEA